MGILLPPWEPIYAMSRRFSNADSWGCAPFLRRGTGPTFSVDRCMGNPVKPLAKRVVELQMHLTPLESHSKQICDIR